MLDLEGSPALHVALAVGAQAGCAEDAARAMALLLRHDAAPDGTRYPTFYAACCAACTPPRQASCYEAELRQRLVQVWTTTGARRCTWRPAAGWQTA